MVDKIAVFSTSEIFRHWYPRLGLPIVAEIETTDGRTSKFASTGSLEKALEDDYTIYVVSTRSSLSEHDEWWLELVDRENVYLADARFEGVELGAWGYEDENVEKANSAWMRLYTKLGFDWPKDGLDGFLDDCPVAHWTTARSELKLRHGIRLGRDFEAPSPRQLELKLQMENGEDHEQQ